MVRLSWRRPVWWAIPLTLLVMALTAWAGAWQWSKGVYKDGLAAARAAGMAAPVLELDAASFARQDLAWRRVRIQGTWQPQAGVWVDNRSHQGKPGYHVMMPLAVAGDSRVVVVNRGWVARRFGVEPAPVPLPQRQVVLKGWAVPENQGYPELAESALDGKVWQNFTFARLRAVFGLQAAPWMVLQTSPSADGLVRDWSLPPNGAVKHYSYAFQWFGFCGLAFVLLLIRHVRITR